MKTTQVPAKANIIASAWNSHAPKATFAGMSVSQFQTTVQPSKDTRDELVAVKAQQRGLIDARKLADTASRDTIQRVVSAVRADANYGPDSPLLAAMNYVTRSQRKSGKTNKSNGHVVPRAAQAGVN